MDEQEKDTTSPPDPTHEATTPPANPERDEEAVEKGKEKLDQAGASQ
jgi:hypothetical protein